MALRTAHNPYGGLTTMVDRLIGDAYPVVRKVYDSMPFIQTVAVALNETNIGSPLLVQRGIVASGATGLPDTTVVIDFPNLDMQLGGILNSHVRITGNDGALYFSDCGWFTTKITSAGLHLTLKAGAPSYLVQALVEWFVIYGE